MKKLLLLSLLTPMLAMGQVTATLHVERAGTLDSVITANGYTKLEINELTVSGSLNGTDILSLRQMAGRSKYGSSTDGQMTVLDMTDANIVAGGVYYSDWDDCEAADNEVGDYMFYETNLTSIKLPATAILIGEEAFCNCKSLEQVVIGDLVQSIGIRAFGQTALQQIDIPASVESLGNYCFSNCSSLQSVQLHDGLLSIGKMAFYFCTNLTDITLSETLTTIGDQAFFDCEQMPQAHIGAACTSIGTGAFNRCYALEAFDVDEENAVYASVDGVLFSKDKSILYRAPISNPLGDYQVPDEVTTIGAYAFDECRYLTSLTMGDQVTEVGMYAFSDCYKLTSLRLSDNITSIPRGMCFNDSSLVDCDLPSSLEMIGASVFMSCVSLKEVTIPEGVTYIGDGAYHECTALEVLVLPSTLEELDQSFYGCVSLKEIYSYATVPGDCGYHDAWGGGVDKQACTLYVPDEAIDAYKEATYWQDFLIVGMDSSGIGDVMTDSNEVMQYYDLNGRQVIEPSYGIYIGVKANGKTIKVLVK